MCVCHNHLSIAFFETRSLTNTEPTDATGLAGQQAFPSPVRSPVLGKQARIPTLSGFYTDAGDQNLSQQVFYLLHHFPRSRRSRTNISELGSVVFEPSSLAT